MFQKYSYLLFLIAMAGCLAGITGCTTYGTVYVSHPQVFTRERLVVARDRELQFLSKQLDAPVSSTFQGAIDQRSLNAFQNGLALTVSPTAGAGTTAATSPTLSDTSGMMPGGAGSMDTAKNVSLSSEDQFDDTWAYRVKVNEVMREEELDDTHDINGKTLYTLKFDTALIPGKRSWCPAIVTINMQPKFDTPNEIKDTYRLWIQQLNKQRSDDEAGLDERLSRGQISSSDDKTWNYYFYDGLMNFCAIAKAKIQDPTMQQRYIDYGTESAQKTLDWMNETPSQRSKDIANIVTNADTDDRNYLFSGMEMALNAKYCHDFAGLASVDYDFNEFAVTNTLVTCQMVPYSPSLDASSRWWTNSEWSEQCQTNGIIQFSDLLITLSSNGATCYADSIDPPMYAQNISDVSSQANLTQLALDINAAIGKPASLDEAMKWTHETQKFLQAIKRQPLAVGFNSGPDFGWYLGAPFGLDKDGNVEFLQVPTRQSFTVSIVVQSWVQHLVLQESQYWLDACVTPINRKTWTNYDVYLPRDMEALTAAIQSRQARTAPKIYLSGQTLLVSTTTNEQTLLIQGSDLWRNPAVFINSTRADAVDLLPNMQGVLAHFKSIPKADEGMADLAVITTFGVDTLPNAINVTSASTNAVTNIPPQAKLTNSFAVNGGQKLVFSLSRMPSSFAGFSIQLNTKGSQGKWQNVADTDYTLGTNQSSVAIAINPTPAPAGPTVYTIALGLRLTPPASPVSLLPGTNQPSFIYFPVKGQELPVVSNVSINYAGPGSPSPIVLSTLAPAAKADLYQAYPGLEQAIAAKAVTFTLSQKATKVASQPLPLQDGGGTGWIVPTTGLSATQLPSAAYDTFTLQYTNNGTPVTIGCASGNTVTVAGHP